MKGLDQGAPRAPQKQDLGSPQPHPDHTCPPLTLLCKLRCSIRWPPDQGKLSQKAKSLPHPQKSSARSERLPFTGKGAQGRPEAS